MLRSRAARNAASTSATIGDGTRRRLARRNHHDRRSRATSSRAFSGGTDGFDIDDIAPITAVDSAFPRRARRAPAPILTHPVFNSHHTETEMLRYIFKLRVAAISRSRTP